MIISVAAVIASVISGCATTGSLMPLPETLNIVTPDPSLGETAKFFSGVSAGTWNNSCSQATTVVLEEIKPATVTGIYAWGTCNGSPGGWIPVSGKMTNSSTIVLTWGEGSGRKTVTLTLVGDKINAEYRRANGVTNQARLTKVPIPTQK